MTVGTSTVAELIICTIDTQKAGYIRCHKQNIGNPKSDLVHLRERTNNMSQIQLTWYVSCPGPGPKDQMTQDPKKWAAPPNLKPVN